MVMVGVAHWAATDKRIGVARGAVGAPAPPGRRKIFSGLIYRKMCKCTPRTRNAPPAKARANFLGQIMLGGLDWRYI